MDTQKVWEGIGISKIPNIEKLESLKGGCNRKAGGGSGVGGLGEAGPAPE